MTVRLTGSVPLKARREVRIVDEHTSLDRDGLAGRFEQVHLPPRVVANARIPVEVVVRNTGQAVWLAEPPGQSGTHGAVGVGLRGWLDADAGPLYAGAQPGQ
jgi:hypothetical protein